MNEFAADAALNFRWCPDDWDDGSEVKVEVLHSPSTKFRWEIEWSLYFEWNQQVVYGDWETQMTLSYETVGSQVLRLKHAEKHVNTSAACVECDLYTASPTLSPTRKPVSPKPKPKSKKSKSRRVLSAEDLTRDRIGEAIDVDEFSADSMESDNILDNYESPQSHLRRLSHKSPATHSPTISPAPTMVQASFTTWEQITLTGSETNGNRNGWDRPYNVNGYATANIPMKYFISDTDGKRLYYEGTKCVVADITCWNDLPAGDRDYILRVGGASTPTMTPAATWTMCGITGGKMEQLDFRVKDYITSNINSDECDALLKVDRSTYCANTLSLTVPVSGIIVLAGLKLDSFSQVDLELLGHAISLVFSPTTLLEVKFEKHMHSSRGAHVGFIVEVPSSVFGLDAHSYDTLNATSFNAIKLLKTADLGSSMDTLLLDLSADGLVSNLKGHGKIYIEDLSISGEIKPTYKRLPYYDDDDENTQQLVQDLSTTGVDSGSISVVYQILNLVQDHTILFVMALVFAVFVYKRRKSSDYDDMNDDMYRKLERKRKKSSAGKLFTKGDATSHSRERKKSARSEKESKKHSRKVDTTPAAGTAGLQKFASKLSDNDGVKSVHSDSYTSRFVPYGSAVEGSRANGKYDVESRLNLSQSKLLDSSPIDGIRDEEDDDFGDELDIIISEFETSSSSSSGSDSDGWQHT